MKRFSIAILLTLLSSTAHANGYSFSIGGHFIHVEASRHCRSLSCVSWSEGGSRRLRRDDDEAAAPARPVAAAPACAPVATPPTAPAPVTPPVRPASVVQAQAPSTIELAAANTQSAVKPDAAAGAPREKATAEATVTDKPVETPDWAKDWSPKDAPAPKPAEVVAHDDDSPIGNWQTGGKRGLVRIETCGAALCGYTLDEATNATAETVLSNMRAKTDAQWVGDIYSRASGNTYYAKMTLKPPGILHVEACAIGRFFCSGNDWTRAPKPDEVSAEDAEHDGADKGKREIRGHDTQPADGHGKLPRHVTARI